MYIYQSCSQKLDNWSKCLLTPCTRVLGDIVTAGHKICHVLLLDIPTVIRCSSNYRLTPCNWCSSNEISCLSTLYRGVEWWCPWAQVNNLACEGMLLSVTVAALLLTLSTEQLLSHFVMTVHLKWTACPCEILTFEQGCSFTVPL